MTAWETLLGFSAPAFDDSLLLATQSSVLSL